MSVFSFITYTLGKYPSCIFFQWRVPAVFLGFTFLSGIYLVVRVDGQPCQINSVFFK